MKNKILFKRIISKALIIGLCLSNIPMYSFANEINIEKTKSSMYGTWEEGVTSIPSNRAGGFKTETVNGKIYVIGGYSNYSQLDSCPISADVYDYVSKPDLCTDPANIVSNRSLSLDGTVEVYDPKTNQWETKASMPTPRKNFGCIAVGTKIYCIGGEREDGTLLNVVEVYDTVNNTWDTTKASMPMANSGFSTVLLEGKIYILGGTANDGFTPMYSTSIYEYDIANNKWASVGFISDERAHFTAQVLGRRIYYMGGEASWGITYDCNAYDFDIIDPPRHVFLDSIPTARTHLDSVLIDDKIYCIGGKNYSGATNVVEVYDITNNIWDTSIPLPTARYDLSVEYVNGKIYCMGGYDNSDNFQSSVYVYTLSSSESAPIEPETISNNIDIYIKPKNNLTLTIDTNSIIFEDFNGVDDMIKENVINLTVESSLPYQINTSLETEIQNSDGTNTLDKSILGIKSNDSDTYKTFIAIKTPLVLWDNQSPGKSNAHSVDLKINKGINYVVDVYKTVLKFEVIQK